jgi:Protein of unknown function (DUF1573)
MRRIRFISRSTLIWVSVSIVVISGALVLTTTGLVPSWAWQLRTQFGGRPIQIEPRTLSLGEIEPGRSSNATFQVTNRSADSAKLLGIIPTCDCIVTNDLPMLIPAGETRRIVIAVAPSKKYNGQHFSKSAVLCFSAGGVTWSDRMIVECEVRSIGHDGNQSVQDSGAARNGAP